MQSSWHGLIVCFLIMHAFIPGVSALKDPKNVLHVLKMLPLMPRRVRTQSSKDSEHSGREAGSGGRLAGAPNAWRGRQWLIFQVSIFAHAVLQQQSFPVVRSSLLGV